MTWDFIEGNTLVQGSGGWLGDTDWVGLVAEHATKIHGAEPPGVLRRSAVEAMSLEAGTLDAVVTDPPYYDAIPYSDLMDFFYVWLRRLLHSSPVEIGSHFTAPLSPKWDAEALDGELVEDASRFGNDRQAARLAYEDGMYRSFQAIWKALRPEGRLVVVFANKQPEAWDALVSALIRAGFQVTGSWPIQTERQARTRSLASAALASSVWLVCRKRPLSARPGFDTTVLEQMRQNIRTKLRRFWDDGIRGPDFVWAATGPALEAFSRHPLVKKADRPGELLSVGEFLHHARRMVVEFVVGRVLASQGGSDQAQSLDNVTTYYLLHRQAFQLEEVPIGPCILYAISCELGDRELADSWDLLQLGGKAGPASGGEEEPEDDEAAEGEGEDERTTGGAKVRLKTFQQRKRKGLGETAPGGKPVPAIDKLHRCLQLWAKGEVADLERYVHTQGLRQDALFHQVLQAVIELSEAGSTERGLLEALSNHLGLDRTDPQLDLPEGATP